MTWTGTNRLNFTTNKIEVSAAHDKRTKTVTSPKSARSVRTADMVPARASVACHASDPGAGRSRLLPSRWDRCEPIRGGQSVPADDQAYRKGLEPNAGTVFNVRVQSSAAGYVAGGPRNSRDVASSPPPRRRGCRGRRVLSAIFSMGLSHASKGSRWRDQGPGLEITENTASGEHLVANA
jgi:hypothetical protein